MWTFNSKEKTDLPQGTYSGIHGAYVCVVIHEGKTYNIRTVEGVRGVGYKASVKVDSEGNATVSF